MVTRWLLVTVMKTYLATVLQRVAAASHSVPAAATVVAHVSSVSRRGFLQIVAAFFDGHDFFPLQFVHLFHQELQLLVLRAVTADAGVHVPGEQKQSREISVH